MTVTLLKINLGLAFANILMLSLRKENQSSDLKKTRTESAQNLWLIKMPWTFDNYKKN